MATSYWIWYPGDYEIRHALKLDSRREERGMMYPAVWRLDDCWHNILLHRAATLEKAETVTVYAHGIGRFCVDKKYHKLGESIELAPGKHDILIELTRINGLPCAFVEGDAFASGKGWEAGHVGPRAKDYAPCGYSAMLTSPDDDPDEFKFSYENIAPAAITKDETGTLYDFGRETFARVYVGNSDKDALLCYGESETEARDVEDCYLIEEIFAGMGERELPTRAFRYLFVPGDVELAISAKYEYLPLEYRGKFNSSDKQLCDIWNIAAYTFHLNSREFFLDGIKRDRWIWSGDAYQSYYVNRCLFMDKEICQRTIWGLRGKDPIEQHINTILDYSLYWIMSISDYYDTFGDADFVKSVWPRVKTLMDYCRASVNADGFIIGQPNDWVFVDWADMDKGGAMSAEQMLFIKALDAAARCAEIAGEDGTQYASEAASVREKLDKFFFDEEKGCYIDCYETGLRNVTRHANTFAILFDIADDEKKQLIIKNVLDNDAVPPITTPYFKFFELWAQCKLGRTAEALRQVRDYWGGMIALGATTIWEAFDPTENFPQHYGMYGNKYGKSLCHAWGAGPIYLLGSYVMGLKPTAPGYKTFTVAPDTAGVSDFEGSLPLPDGHVDIAFNDGHIKVCASRDGGRLIWQGQDVELPAGQTVEL